MPYRSPLWQSRYPNLPGILDDDPGTPKRNRVRRNLCMGGKWESIDARTRSHQMVEGNIIDDALEIDDLEREHFLVLVNIRNGRHGFRSVPVDRIGVYRDRRRASWPVSHDHIQVARPPSESRKRSD